MKKPLMQHTQFFQNTFFKAKLVFLLLLFLGFFSFAKASNLEDFSDELSFLCEKTLPSVVMVKVHGQLSENKDSFDHRNDPFFKEHFPEATKFPYVSATGSGFLVSPDGYIVTCFHVVDFPNSKIRVTLHRGQEYEATVIGTDPRIDLAILKIEGTNFPHLAFGNSDDLKIGSFVLAIGTPLYASLQSTITFGLISAKSRHFYSNEIEDYLQTDASTNPGNSGGPLISLKGTVIGLNSNIITTPGGDASSIGLGFAVSSNLIQRSYKQIIENKNPTLPFIGVTFAPSKDYYDNSTVTIIKILADSPAQQAGLKINDKIIECNNIKIKSLADFRNHLYLSSLEDKISLTIIRDNQKLKLTIQPESKPDLSFLLNSQSLL